MRISDWSSDVCSSDLVARPWHAGVLFGDAKALGHRLVARLGDDAALSVAANQPYSVGREEDYAILVHGDDRHIPAALIEIRNDGRSDEHTSEIKSLMRTSYTAFLLKKKNDNKETVQK